MSSNDKSDQSSDGDDDGDFIPSETDDDEEGNHSFAKLEEDCIVHEDDEKRKERLSIMFKNFISEVEPITSSEKMFNESKKANNFDIISPKNHFATVQNKQSLFDKKIATTEENFLEDIKPSTTMHTPSECKVNTINEKAGVQNKKRSSSGLDNAIRCLSKKSKMNVLERTQQDWQEFKNGAGIVEELDNHNRGKCGYIDRMAFLNRADLRTFELERNARNVVRNKKK